MNIPTVGLRTNPELRAVARERLSGKWLSAILACLVFGVILGVSNVIRGLGPFLVGGPLALGLANFFLKLNRREPAIVEDLFAGFKNYIPALALHLLIAAFVLLWSLLLIVPGIIAGCSYAMAFYILRDNPGIGALEAIRTSRLMMMGHKGQLFMLSLSFIGWWILCVLTAGIGFLWLVPYMSASFAAFYEDLKNVAAGTGIDGANFSA